MDPGRAGAFSPPRLPPRRSRVREGGWGRGMTRAGAEGGREADTKPFLASPPLPPPTAPPGRGKSARRQSAGLRSPPSPRPAGRACARGGRRQRRPHSLDLHPKLPRRPQQAHAGRGSAGFRAQGASLRTLLPPEETWGAWQSGGCGSWGRMGKGHQE